MPLSEHEQRLLDQLEQQLGADDPTFAQSMNHGSGAVRQSSFSARHLVIGALIALVGLGVVIAGVASKIILIGVLGFLLTAAGLYFATIQSNSVKAKTQGVSQSKPKSPSQFMQNLEGKWDQRQKGHP